MLLYEIKIGKGVYMNNESHPLWTSVNDVPRQYPWLSNDTECTVCVIGGGLTGALCALKLAQAGEDVVLLSDSPIGFSSTADTAPAACFDFGHRIVDLKKKIGTENSLNLFEMGAQAIDMLESLSDELDSDFGFRRCDALLYTNDERELDLFNREYLMRKHNGFDCSFLNRSASRDVFSFPIAGGIISKGLAAYFDPYRLTHLCVQKAHNLGARIFENTKVSQLDSHGRTVVIETATRQTVHADRCVIAVGNIFDDILNAPTQKLTGFYSVSDTVDSYPGWTGKCIIRTWAQPGITISPTPDGRVYCGGLETSALDENGRLYGVLNLPSLASKKFDELDSSVRCHFPAMEISDFCINRAVRCTVTQDSLPIIGTDINHDKCFFACCTGHDSVLYSVLASDILLMNLTSGFTEETYLFSPMRFSRKQARIKH